MQHGFAISPLLQTHTLRFATHLPFRRSVELLNITLPAAGMSASQSQRLCYHFGSLEEVETALRSCRQAEPVSAEASAQTPPPESTDPSVLYCQIDGGMILTDQGYNEVKVGRLFTSADRHQVSSRQADNKRFALKQSEYLAHHGKRADFLDRFTPLLQSHRQHQACRLVFVSDGAHWIQSWQDGYPEAVQILDYYHALEALASFARQALPDHPAAVRWLRRRRAHLLEGDVDKVLKAVRAQADKGSAEVRQAAARLTGYYERNARRMRYGEFRAKGYLIGSGAIESAVSGLVQQRCKLVGQRWGPGLKGVLNLRTLVASGKITSLRRIVDQQMRPHAAA